MLVVWQHGDDGVDAVVVVDIELCWKVEKRIERGRCGTE